MKKILILLIAFVLVLSFAFSAVADNFDVCDTTYDMTYEDILDMYLRVFNTNGSDGYHDLYNGAVYEYVPEMPTDQAYAELKKAIGYCIYDLNNDGIDELILAGDSVNVFEVFTMDNSKVRELIRAGIRYNCALMTNGRFYRFNNSGASLNSSTVWKMSGTDPVQYVEGYHEDDEYGAYYGSDGLYHIHEYQWFRMTDPDDWSSSDETLVTIDEYLDWLKAQDEQLLQLSFVPLATREKGVDSENKGVISVKGRTNGREKVNIRAGASKKTKLVKEVYTGTYVNILGEEGDFYHISFSDKEGYVHKDFLTLVNSEASTERKTIYYSDDNVAYMKSRATETSLAPGNNNDEEYIGSMVTDSVTDKEASVFNGTLKVGSDSNDVLTVKSRLYDLGYFIGVIDAIFDDSTRQAVIDFQENNGLTGDGLVGYKTWSTLLSPTAKPKTSENMEKESEHVSVIDHYETVEVRRSREVYDHDEVTLEDDGNGHFVEVSHPVYRTEYYTVTEQQPVYRQELRKEN